MQRGPADPVNALVTGAAGFLGRYLVEQLVAQGACVRALVRHPNAELARLNIAVVQADLRDREAVAAACRNIDVVYHTAGVMGLWGSWRHFHQNNVLATEHLIRACRTEGVGRLVFTSSPSVTFDGGDQLGIDETAPYAHRWLCHYARSKAIAEQAVLAANDGRLATCALRPHLVWGPRDPHLLPRLIARAKAGRLRRIGDGTNRIDVTYVENAAEAHRLAAAALCPGSPVAGRAYFISQGEPVACGAWIDALLDAAGLPPVGRRVSFSAARRWGAMLELLWSILPLRGEPPMTRFLAAEMAASHFFDIRRAETDFGYRPRISTAEGLRRLAAWLSADPATRS